MSIPAGPGKPMVIGIVAPFSGPRSYVGETVVASLGSAAAYIRRDLGGSINGYRPVFVQADAPLSPADGVRAYATLSARRVDAVLWCGALGLDESVPAIVRDLIPVIATGNDLQSRAPTDPRVPDLTGSAASGFPVFQTAVPDAMAFDVLCGYLRDDRGLQTAGLLFSTSDYTGADAAFDAACRRHGLRNAGAQGYDGSAPTPDPSASLAATRAAAPQAVVLWAPPEAAAAVAIALDAMGARYADTPAARKGPWKPMLLGAPTGVGDAAFRRLAAGHIAPGTIAVGALGAFVGLPKLPIRDWITTYAPTYGALRGGEVGPADAMAALLNAAAVASSAAGADVVAALESGVVSTFASPVGLSFAADRHLSIGAGDLALFTTELPGEARYTLGSEWRGGSFAGADLLLDYTLAENTKAHPDLMAAVLAARLGSSCRPDYQGTPARISACQAAH